MLEKETARYLGIKAPDQQTTELINQTVRLISDLRPSFSTAYFDVNLENNGIKLCGTDITLFGNLAKKHFFNCKKIIVVLATLGLKSEILMKQVFSQSATKAVVLDAVYTAKIESFLDEIEEEIKLTHGEITSRISCGYGDLPLSTQKALFDVIEGEKLGVGMNECYMLTPNKSVIALVGLK